DQEEGEENGLEEEAEGSTSGDEENNIEIEVVTRKSARGDHLAKKEDSDSGACTDRTDCTERSAPTGLQNGASQWGGHTRQRRTKNPDLPNHSLNLWSIMKNAIGKELTKIPMPVNFNEPLSMLQRMTEEFEYADILHRAAKITDPLEQLAYVAAFSVT